MCVGRRGGGRGEGGGSLTEFSVLTAKGLRALTKQGTVNCTNCLCGADRAHCTVFQ